jgi:hypothetical protein
MPHQQLVARLTTEVLPSGEWAYTTIVATTPRQAGKTTVRGPIALHRCIIRPMARCWLTAQTRQDARDILIEQTAIRWERSPLRQLARVRRSQGSEGIYFGSGSSWRAFAPGDEALHGKANELVDVDESWTLSASQGAAIDQAVGPTMLTTGGQLSTFSTRGTAQSEWLDGMITLGRQAVIEGRREGIALIDYSLGDTGDELVEEVRAGLHHEPHSPQWLAAVQVLIDHHPATGYTLRPRALIGDVEKMCRTPETGPDGALRAYGNVATRTTRSLIAPTHWDWCRARGDWPEPTPPVALAIAAGIDPGNPSVALDAAIAAAWMLPTGAIAIDIVHASEGTTWLPAMLPALRATLRPVALVHPGAGPSGDLATRAAAAGAPVTALTGPQYASACAGLLTGLADRTIVHPGHAALDAAAGNVAPRYIGDGSVVFGRLASAASIAPIEAAAAARWSLLSALPAPVAPAFTAAP